MPAFVGAGTQGVATPRVAGEMDLHSAHLPHPLTPLLVVSAVHLEAIHTLLEMDVAEVIEALRLAGGAGVVGVDPLLYASLAVVGSAADHLSRVTKHFRAELAHQFVRDLPREIVSGASVVHLCRHSVIHCYDLRVTYRNLVNYLTKKC